MTLKELKDLQYFIRNVKNYDDVADNYTSKEIANLEFIIDREIRMKTLDPRFNHPLDFTDKKK